MQSPAIPAADRQKTTVTLTADPYVNQERLVGALNIANAKNARNVQRVDERDAVLAGEGSPTK